MSWKGLELPSKAWQKQCAYYAGSGCMAPPERLRCRREWADIVAELHRRNQFWVVAGILAELVPTGRAAVEAQKAVYDCYGSQLVCHTRSIAQVYVRSWTVAAYKRGEEKDARPQRFSDELKGSVVLWQAQAAWFTARQQ